MSSRTLGFMGAAVVLVSGFMAGTDATADNKADWVDKCVLEMQCAHERLTSKAPGFAKGSAFRAGIEAGKWVRAAHGNSARYSACLEGSWCFVAQVEPIEMTGLNPEELPWKWEELPEVTVCLSSGRRTKELFGSLWVQHDDRCLPDPARKKRVPVELREFEKAFRPVVEKCLRDAKR